MGKKDLKKLRKQTRKLLKAQRKMMKLVARPAIPAAAGGILLAGLAWLGQRLGLGDSITGAIGQIRDKLGEGPGANGTAQAT